MSHKQFDYDKPKLDPDILVQARDGHPVAQPEVGEEVLCIHSIGKDDMNSFDLVLQSAKQGNMKAQFKLADLYVLGQGIQKNQAKAYHWYTKAALQGYKKALIRIHNLYQQDKRMYCRGQLNSSEEEWIYEWFQKEHNIRELNEYRREQHAAILNNAVEYYTGQFKHYKSSNQESVESDLYLAFFYHYGYGTRKNMLLAFDFYRKAAEEGHKDAQYGLAYLYQSNPNIKFNYRLALRWYRASATNGNVAAQNCLGYFYEKGLATELNYEGALYWYTKAANSGNSSAQLTLGRLYRKGQSVEQSLSEAIKWYKLAAYQKNSAAQNCLNQLYLAGKIQSIENVDSVLQSPVSFTLRSKLQKDIADLHSYIHINKLKKLAQHALMTDGYAMYQIGLKYYNGEGFIQDKDAGFQWMKKAAKAGLVEAELKIAKMYECGDVVDNDYHKSSLWIVKAAKKRNNIALLNLGIFYKYGLGVRKDPLEASKWFVISGDRGNIQAQYHFNLLKFYGEGVRKDQKEAFMCFYKQALLGNTNALYLLGWLYESDDSVGAYISKDNKTHKPIVTSKDYRVTEAIKFYKSAAALGNPDAHFRLARIYEEGNVTKQDLAKAYEHYTIAANSDNPYYQTELAVKYINGDFDDEDYIKAFNLFKKAAEKKEPRAAGIFQTPIQLYHGINDYSKVIDMFILASERDKNGIHGIEYNIGYAYDYGIAIKDEIIFRRHYPYSKLWYSIAEKRGDSRVKYRKEVIHEDEKRVKKYQNIASSSYYLAYESGNSDIAYNLALMYLHGEHVPHDFIRAYNLFTAASNMGHKEAQERLIISKYSGNMEMLEAVANSGNVAVQYQLGIYFENNNDPKSVEWLTMASEGGISDACYRLGVVYEEGRGLHSNYLKAIRLYEEATKKEHESALYRLARIYHYGKGTEVNYAKAYDLYTRAANLSHTEALKVLNLSGKHDLLHHEYVNKGSLGSSSNEFSTNILMLKYVANQDDVGLQFKLGYFYENNQNYSEAFIWYVKAVDNNHTEAIYRLGLLYENGLGVQQDYSKSIQLYSKAKNEEHPGVLYRLAIAFHHGFGTDRNPTSAIEYYTKAAKLENDEAQYTLGRLYETGELVQRDIMEALALYTKAYINGNIDAIPILHNLYEEEPYKGFGRTLFQNLSKFENSRRGQTTVNQIDYGSIYYKLGKMYLRGLGTKKSYVEALKRFLIAENKYSYSDAKPFTTFRYNKYNEEKSVYLQRMEAYFEIRHTLTSEQQYRIGMVYYEDTKRYYENDQIEINDTVPSVFASREDNTAYEYLLLAAKNNHPKAQYQLGIMYLLGHTVDQNEKMAIEWFEKFAEAIERSHCFTIGMDFYTGNGVIQNYRVSFIFIKKAAEKDDCTAQAQLSSMYIRGCGVEKNKEEGSKWIEKSTENRKPYVVYLEAIHFLEGKRVDNNYDIALCYVKKAAQENHVPAMVQLGSMYFHGYGVKPNYEEAIKWIQHSIKYMEAYDCYVQGIYFFEGKTIDRNYEIALLYLKKAAEKNLGKALAQLGIMYFQGYGVEHNYQEALKWIRQSIEILDSKQCYSQGIIFFEGCNVDKNYDIALLYLKKAAEENYSEAQAQLGVMYLHGYGVEKSHDEAIKWIQQSLKYWGPRGCYEQGMKFYEGNKVIQSYEIALLYLKHAAIELLHTRAQAQLGIMYLENYGVEQNHEDAVEYIQQSMKGLTPESCYIRGMEYYQGNKASKNDTVALIYLKKAADENYSEAQVQLGTMYLFGSGIDQNQEKAIKWFQKSVKEMDSEHCYEQGMTFYQDNTAEINYEIPLLYIKKAAENNYNKAQAQLGVMHLRGHGIEQSHKKAMEWIQTSIKSMTSHECYEQGMKFYRDTEVDDAISFLYIKKAAEEHHVYAQAQLGLMYLKGHGIEENLDKSIELVELSLRNTSPHEWYSHGINIFNSFRNDKVNKILLPYFIKAAEQVHIYSHAQLGLMYLNGYGTSHDYDEAARWYNEAVDEYPRYPACTIGQIYHYDHGGIQNFSKAFEWYHRESRCRPGRNAVRTSLYGIGLLYEYGDGVSQDYQKAFEYYKRSASYGNIGGLYRLGLLYYHGRGVDQNYVEALSSFTRIFEYTSNSEEMHVFIEDINDDTKSEAAKSTHRNYSLASRDRIHGEAYRYIGIMHKNGKGIAQNKKEAYVYFKKAFECEIKCVKSYIK